MVMGPRVIATPDNRVTATASRPPLALPGASKRATPTRVKARVSSLAPLARRGRGSSAKEPRSVWGAPTGWVPSRTGKIADPGGERLYVSLP